MTRRKSKRELERAVDEFDTPADEVSDTGAFALLVKAANGDEAALERWRQLPTEQRDRLTEEFREGDE